MEKRFEGNSHRAKELAAQEDRKIEKVVSGNAVVKKKNGLTRAAESLMPGDAKSIGSYILMDVLIPSIKRAISDIVCNGINMLLGEPVKGKNSSGAAKISYRQYYREPEERRDYAKPRTQSAYSYDDIIFESRGDAEAVLDRMMELLERFDVVSVADLFDMAGISCNYTDNKYGWTDLRDAGVRRVRDGYVIDLPRATSL